MNNKHFKFQKYERYRYYYYYYYWLCAYKKIHLPPTTNLYCLAETPPSTIMTVPVTHLASFEHR
jgi:hypothetical protein